MEQSIKFRHKVSKGSKFNQIYIPREAEADFEVGDLVEVKLIEKKKGLYYSKNLPKLNKFKELLVREVFSFLDSFVGVEQVFVVGSFLTSNDWDDFDLIVVGSGLKDEEITKQLKEKFGFKFHVIVVDMKRLNFLSKMCPLTKSMFYYYVSDKEHNISKERIIDVNHIEYLLMMPEDLLDINVNGKVFYDIIKRLISIERFLNGKNIDPIEINKDVVRLLGERNANYLGEQGIVDGLLLKELRSIIKDKLIEIRGMYGKKR